jgi:hypothetical protein
LDVEGAHFSWALDSSGAQIGLGLNLGNWVQIAIVSLGLECENQLGPSPISFLFLSFFSSFLLKPILFFFFLFPISTFFCPGHVPFFSFCSFFSTVSSSLSFWFFLAERSTLMAGGREDCLGSVARLCWARRAGCSRLVIDVRRGGRRGGWVQR